MEELKVKNPLQDEKFRAGSLSFGSIEDRRRFEQNLIKFGVLKNEGQTIEFKATSPFILPPSGTGPGQTGEIRFLELAADGEEYVGLKSPDKLSKSTTWVLPEGDGSKYQFLQTDGAGNLAFAWPYWKKIGNDIYYPIGKVGIGNILPTKELDVDGDVYIRECLYLDVASSATDGVIYKGTNRWLHDFKHSVATGRNIFLGELSGNFTMVATIAAESSDNIGIGYGTLTSLTTGKMNVAIGTAGLGHVTTGYYNLAIGDNAAHALTDSYSVIAIGKDSLKMIATAAYGNIGMGDFTLSVLTSNYTYNTAGGYSSCCNLTQGDNNAAYGAYSLGGASNWNTCAFGYQAGRLAAGQESVFMGAGAGYNVTTGDKLTVIGRNAAYTLTTGRLGVYLGHKAGYWETGDAKLFIDNDDRTDEATARTLALIYGVFAGTTATQYLYLNAKVSTPEQFTSTLAGGGISPLAVTSTVVCTNLNADLLDGSHAAAFAASAHTHVQADITGLLITDGPTFDHLHLTGVEGIYIGTNDVNRGLAYLYGPATGGTYGGTLICYTGADYDTTVSNYGFMVYLEDLCIGPDTNTDALKLDKNDDLYVTAGSVVLPASEYLNFGGVLGAGGYGVRDNAGTVEFKNSGGAWVGVGTVTAHNILSASHGDSTAAAVVRGDIIIGSVAAPNTKWTRLAVGAAGTYLAGGDEPSYATLNQAAVAGLTTASSPEFVTVKCSGLTDSYVPYHVADATGLANSPIWTDGTDVNIGTTGVATKFVVVDVGDIIKAGNGTQTFDMYVTAGLGALGMYSVGDDLRLFVDNDITRGITVKATTGNVGLGTTGPASKLDLESTTSGYTTTLTINGGAAVGVGDTVSKIALGTNESGVTASDVELRAVRSVYVNPNATDFAIAIAGTERVRVTKEGKALIASLKASQSHPTNYKAVYVDTDTGELYRIA